MTTDVINGVPRSLLERIAKPVLLRSHEDAHADACAELRALLATAQPADHSEHDLNMVSQPAADVCDTCNGHGLIGGFVNAESGYESQLCPDCNAQPAADGEREADHVPGLELALEAMKDHRVMKGGVHVFAIKILEGMLEKARAAHPQQAAAVTDEVRKLREALIEIDRRNDSPARFDAEINRIVQGALSHKTGEEE